MPEITVMMCAYNAEAHLQEALDSILGQSFQDFELLVVDDGSTDRTLAILAACDDARLRVINREHGYIDSLNEGLRLSSGKYIARMDADDRMHPDRLMVQHAIMEAEPSIDLCASHAQAFGDKVDGYARSSGYAGLVDHPRKKFILRNFIIHPTVMIRKTFLTEHSLTYKDYPYAEDYKLWDDMAKCDARFYIEPQVLMYYRFSDNQVSIQKKKEQKATAERIQEEIISDLIAKSEQKILLHNLLQSMLQLEKTNQTPRSALVNYIYTVI